MRKTSHENPEVGPKPTGLGHQDPSGPHSPVNLQAVRLGKPNRGDLEFQPPAGGSSQAQPGNQGFCKYSWLHYMN